MNRNEAIVYHDTFDGKGFTDENSLANAMLTEPDAIDPVITHLLGLENKKLPLSFLSEGQGKSGSQPVKDIQYTYGVMNRLNKPLVVVKTDYSAGDNPGVGVSTFWVTFKTNWAKYQHTIESANGTVARINGQPIPDGPYYKYPLELITADPSESCPISELQPGTKWVMTAGANVAQSRSEGTSSNVVMPGKMKNQLSILRKSYRIAGNISNKTVECKFTVNGKKTSLWMNFEQWQHLLNWKVDLEEHCWWAKYNRTANGEILNKDKTTGEPIPVMAGLDQQIPNRDTYSFLTASKLKKTVRDVMFGATDTGKMDVVLFTGIGGMEEFDSALKEESAGFSQVTGDKFVRGAGNHLILGGYFHQYEHVDGHVITVKHLPLLDEGNRALKAPLHPITNLPMTSYEMYFIDMSVYDGARNLVMMHEEGRSMVTGILQGMAQTPMNFSGNSKNLNLATERDESSIHFMATKSILLRRNTHCFKLECDLS